MEHRIHLIVSNEDPRAISVVALFEALYAEEALAGSPAVLAAEGGERWLKRIGAGLERFGRLVLAEVDGVIVGFAHGALWLPDTHRAGGPMGTITHVYVLPAHRRSGIARAMLLPLNDWFASRHVSRVELSVVAGNGAALEFWRSQGFEVRIHQLMRS